MRRKARYGKSSDDDPIVTDVVESLTGFKLEIANLYGDVIIRPGKGKMSMLVAGKRSRVQALQCTTDDGVFRISGDMSGEESPKLVFEGRASVPTLITCLLNGTSRTFLSQKGVLYKPFHWWLRSRGSRFMMPTDKVEVVIEVPPGSDVTLHNTYGKLKAKVPLGDVYAEPGFNSSTELSVVRSIHVDSHSYTRMIVGRVSEGELTLHPGWNSTIIVNDGRVSNLEVNVHGESKVEYYGVTTSAAVHASQRSTVTTGRIIDNAHVAATEGSTVTINGTVQRGLLSANSGAVIKARAYRSPVIRQGHITTY